AGVRRKRGGQHEISVNRVGEAEKCRRPEGKAQIMVAEKSADGRADDESQAECGADESERLGAFIGRSDVGDIGEGGGNIGGGDAGNEAAHKKPAKRWRHSHENVVNRQAETRNEDDGAPAEAV